MDQRVRILRLLLKNGADVNARDENGDTPLALALRFEKQKAAKVLKRAGGTR